MLLAIRIDESGFIHDGLSPTQVTFDPKASEITILALGGVREIHVLSFECGENGDGPDPIILVANTALIGVKSSQGFVGHLLKLTPEAATRIQFRTLDHEVVEIGKASLVLYVQLDR
jgi:hypothetical protein